MADRKFIQAFWWLEGGRLIKANATKRQIVLGEGAPSLWIVDDIYSCIAMIKSLRWMGDRVATGQIEKIEEMYKITNADYLKYAVVMAAKEGKCSK